jgi:hypothetical protein
MGVQVLSPESHHSKLRSLPKLPKTSHYSVKPLNSVKHSRALPSVPNSNLAKLDSNVKQSRALPRVPKHMDNKKASNMVARQGRTLPEVPFRDLKDNFTASSSRSSTPHLVRNTSNLTQNSTSQHAVVIHNTTQQHNTNSLTHHHHHHHHKGENHHHKGENHHHKGESHHHKGENHHHNHHHQHGPQHLHVKEHQHGNTTQRTLPKLPKLSQKPKPEQNRIEYMHDVYKKEGDIFSEDGNYEQALKSYNLVCCFT